MAIRADFYQDPFLHMIELVDQPGAPDKPIAGANNIAAARSTYAELLKHYHPQTTLQLRERSRIITKDRCTGERAG
jgi:hypothetical protein